MAERSNVDFNFCLTIQFTKKLQRAKKDLWVAVQKLYKIVSKINTSKCIQQCAGRDFHSSFCTFKPTSRWIGHITSHLYHIVIRAEKQSKIVRKSTTFVSICSQKQASGVRPVYIRLGSQILTPFDEQVSPSQQHPTPAQLSEVQVMVSYQRHQ